MLGPVNPRAPNFAFEVACPGSIANAALLGIREIAGAAWCIYCSERLAIFRRGNPCPDCGGYGMIVEQGDELRPKQLEVI